MKIKVVGIVKNYNYQKEGCAHNKMGRATPYVNPFRGCKGKDDWWWCRICDMWYTYDDTGYPTCHCS